MNLLWTLCLALLPASAHPMAGQTSVVVVMKTATCSVCVTQLRALGEARLGVSLAGITHDPPLLASAVTRATGVRTTSHAEGIVAMGLWSPRLGIAQPAVVVYDRCGEETGRIVDRRPGLDVTDRVRELIEQAEAVGSCGSPLT